MIPFSISILIWLEFDRSPIENRTAQKPFIKSVCKVTNCWVTGDRTLLEQSDAVIFHGGLDYAVYFSDYIWSCWTRTRPSTSNTRKKDYDMLRGPLDGWCDLCDKLNDPAEPARVSIHVTPVWLCYPEESLIKTQKCWWSVTLLTESSSHPSKETFKRTNGVRLLFLPRINLFNSTFFPHIVLKNHSRMLSVMFEKISKFFLLHPLFHIFLSIIKT
jgi:hypothetical protein